MIENKILIVEDDEETALWTKEYLQDCNFNITIFSTITDAIYSIQFNKYDLIVLDLNFPDYNGFELLKFLNKNKIKIPTIIVSAYSGKKTKLQAFKYGASDYMIKPIDFEELEARIWVHISNNSHFQSEKDKKIFEIKKDKILFKDEILKLTKLEFKILSILLKNKNNLISRKYLAKALSSKANERSLDYHIGNIRVKIGDDGSTQKYLVTEYGMGYKLVEDSK